MSGGAGLRSQVPAGAENPMSIDPRAPSLKPPGPECRALIARTLGAARDVGPREVRAPASASLNGRVLAS
jgi:hypothetical protein